MREPLRMKTVALSLALLLPAAVLVDAPASAADPQEPTLQLGKITVSGQYQIVRALRAIKVALHTSFSNDPAHADDVVCRINKALGEQHEYLDCATNRNYTRRRDAVHIAGITGTTGLPAGGDIQMFNALITAQPEHQLHVPVQGGALQALPARTPRRRRIGCPGRSCRIGSGRGDL